MANEDQLKEKRKEAEKIFIDCSMESGDNVYHPSHYTQYKGMEPFTFIMLNGVPFAEGCVVKYVLRWRQKNGIEDLKKARRVIDMMIELETNKHKYLPEVRAL